MIRLRAGQQSDLPQLMSLAAQNAWSILPAEEQQDPSQFGTVAEAAHHNLMGMLSTPGGGVLIADVGGQIGGYLLVGIGPDSVTGEPFGYLADVWVHPQVRKHGVGQAMVQAAEGHLRSLGITRAKAWIHAHNAAPQRLLTGLGYQPEGIVMNRHLGPTQFPVALPFGSAAGLPTAGLPAALAGKAALPAAII